jgi:hypothetical protein
MSYHDDFCRRMRCHCDNRECAARQESKVRLNQGREYGALLPGMPIGGVLYGISRAIPFLADGVSYAASFISLLAPLERHPRERHRDARALAGRDRRRGAVALAAAIPPHVLTARHRERPDRQRALPRRCAGKAPCRPLGFLRRVEIDVSADRPDGGEDV